MKKLLTIIGGISLVVLISANASALPLIENGGFEADVFDPFWQVSDPNSESTWVINQRDDSSTPPAPGINPPGPGEPLPPITGFHDAKSVQTNIGSSWISQSFSVPVGSITSAILSWSDRIENYAGSFRDGDQEFRVEIFSTSPADPFVEEIFSTNRPDYTDPPVQIGSTFRSFDVTSILQPFEGQSLTLSFLEDPRLDYFNVTLDDISLEVQTTPVPEPATILFLSTGLIGLACYSRKRRQRK